MSWSYRRDESDSDVAADKVSAYSADGAIDVRSHKAILNKGSAGAYTLAAPTQDGIDLYLLTGSAFAHVVTSTGRLDDGVTGGGKNAWTAAAFVGSSLHLVSFGGHWIVVSKNLGVIA